MVIQIRFEVTDKELVYLSNLAHLKYGLKREIPQRSWTDAERKYFAKIAINNLVADHVNLALSQE